MPLLGRVPSPWTDAEQLQSQTKGGRPSQPAGDDDAPESVAPGAMLAAPGSGEPPRWLPDRLNTGWKAPATVPHPRGQTSRPAQSQAYPPHASFAGGSAPGSSGQRLQPRNRRLVALAGDGGSGGGRTSLTPVGTSSLGLRRPLFKKAVPSPWTSRRPWDPRTQLVQRRKSQAEAAEEENVEVDAEKEGQVAEEMGVGVDTAVVGVEGEVEQEEGEREGAHCGVDETDIGMDLAGGNENRDKNVAGERAAAQDCKKRKAAQAEEEAASIDASGPDVEGSAAGHGCQHANKPVSAAEAHAEEDVAGGDGKRGKKKRVDKIEAAAPPPPPAETASLEGPPGWIALTSVDEGLPQLCRAAVRQLRGMRLCTEVRIIVAVA